MEHEIFVKFCRSVPNDVRYSSQVIDAWNSFVSDNQVKDLSFDSALQFMQVFKIVREELGLPSPPFI